MKLFQAASLLFAVAMAASSNMNVQAAESIHKTIQKQRRHVVFNSRQLTGECCKYYYELYIHNKKATTSMPTTTTHRNINYHGNGGPGIFKESVGESCCFCLLAGCWIRLALLRLASLSPFIRSFVLVRSTFLVPHCTLSR
jgi:hypothetical protein